VPSNSLFRGWKESFSETDAQVFSNGRFAHIIAALVECFAGRFAEDILFSLKFGRGVPHVNTSNASILIFVFYREFAERLKSKCRR